MFSALYTQLLQLRFLLRNVVLGGQIEVNCDRSDEQDAAVAVDSNDASADALLMPQRHHHLDNYVNVDSDKPLNLEMNKTGVRSPHTPLSDRHGTPTCIAGLCNISVHQLQFTSIHFAPSYVVLAKQWNCCYKGL